VMGTSLEHRSIQDTMSSVGSSCTTLLLDHGAVSICWHPSTHLSLVQAFLGSLTGRLPVPGMFDPWRDQLDALQEDYILAIDRVTRDCLTVHLSDQAEGLRWLCCWLSSSYCMQELGGVSGFVEVR